MVFNVLKSSRGIVRKSQKVSAFNFDPKRVKKGAQRNGYISINMAPRIKLHKTKVINCRI